MTQEEINKILADKQEDISKLEMVPFGKSKDLTGQIFNNLYVLGRDKRGTDNPGKKHVYIMCLCLRCKEHNIISVLKDNMTAGKIKSCGCIRKDCAREGAIRRNQKNKINLTGKIFGNLYVVKEHKEKKSDSDKHIYWDCRCLNCGREDFYVVRTDSLTYGLTTCCDRCSSHISMGELAISKLLTNNSIQYISQKTFDSCRFPDTKALAKFDFYLPAQNVLIEFDGKQHFYEQSANSLFTNLEYVQYHDNVKNQWCKNNNITLIRIPYTHLQKLCLQDLLPETSSFIYMEEKERTNEKERYIK